MSKAIGGVVLLLPLVLPGLAGAGILMSESFDYPLGESLNAKAGGTGWGAANPWSVNNGTATIIAGLTFGNLITSGNAVELVNTGSEVNVGRLAYTLPADGSTLFLSYLYRQPGTGITSDTVVEVRVNTSAAAGYGSSTMRAWGKVYGDGGSGAGGVSWDKSDRRASGRNLQDGAVYLLVYAFENLNLGASGNPQVARFWALTQANFAAIQADAGFTGSFTQALLGAYASVTDTHSITYPETLAAGEFVQLTTFKGYGVYDELRWGQSLNDVMPIPEPATMALLALGLAGWALRRR